MNNRAIINIEYKLMSTVMLNFNMPSGSKSVSFTSDVENLSVSAAKPQPEAVNLRESIARVANTASSVESIDPTASAIDARASSVVPKLITPLLTSSSNSFADLPSTSTEKESDQANANGEAKSVDDPNPEKNSTIARQKTYSLEDFGIIDKSNVAEAKKYIEIEYMQSGKGSILINTLFNFEAKKKFQADIESDVFYDKKKSLISFFALDINGKSRLPFTATDIFQVMYDHCVEDGLISEIKNVYMMGISSYENKSLAGNLEKIRIDNNLSYQEKITKMEKEIFSGNHAGKSVFRRLNRIGYEPICNSLKISAEEMQETPIKAGLTRLAFSVARKNSPS